MSVAHATYTVYREVIAQLMQGNEQLPSLPKFLARHIPLVAEDQVLLASLLSEIGTLGVLSAFKDRTQPPSEEIYVSLCREYSKSLGVIMMKKWQVDDEFIQVIRRIGDWPVSAGEALDLSDMVNLGLFHALKLRKAGRDLPLLAELAAYRKLSAPFNALDQHDCLSLVTQHIADIRALAIALFKVEV